MCRNLLKPLRRGSDVNWDELEGKCRTLIDPFAAIFALSVKVRLRNLRPIAASHAPTEIPTHVILGAANYGSWDRLTVSPAVLSASSRCCDNELASISLATWAGACPLDSCMHTSFLASTWRPVSCLLCMHCSLFALRIRRPDSHRLMLVFSVATFFNDIGEPSYLKLNIFLTKYVLRLL